MKFFWLIALFLPIYARSQTNFANSITYLNKIRTQGCYCGDDYKNKANALTWSDTLAQAALIHANYLSATGKFSHAQKNIKYKTPLLRVQSVKYSPSTVGENIFKGEGGPQEIIDAWYKSQTHCDNLMYPAFTQVGIAKVNNYWVMILAAKF